MANYYDPAAMKKGAEQIQRELEKFNSYRSEIDSIITRLSRSWNDENNRKYAGLYKREAAASMKDAAELMQKYAEFLKMCSRKYGNAIDTGNSNLSM
jgi:uncharacterized protein YukE